VTIAVGRLLIKRQVLMRSEGWKVIQRFALVLSIAMLALAIGEPAVAQDRTTNCRPLAERGWVWVDCCNQSFARNPTRAISRRARMRSIERCVRNRLRPT
jgi:hypothetical protein